MGISLYNEAVVKGSEYIQKGGVRMKSLQAKAKQLVKGIADHAIRKEMQEWPPKCVGSILYQPRRPSLQQAADKTAK